MSLECKGRYSNFNFTVHFQSAIYLIIILATFYPLGEYAQTLKVDCNLQTIDDRKIKILTNTEATNKRLEIIQAIWDTNHLPGRSDVIVTPNIENPLSPTSVIARVDKIEIPTHIPVAEGSETNKDLAYLFVPIQRNNRLVIVHHGHACTFKDAYLGEGGYRMEVTIISLLAAGYDVLAVYMPLISETASHEMNQ